MAQRIYFDGLNLSLKRGTGIATYTRTLTEVLHGLGREVGVVYSSPRGPAKNPVLREIAFFDEAVRLSPVRKVLNDIEDGIRCHFPLRPVPVPFTGVVVKRQFEGRLPAQDRAFVVRNLFGNARRFFGRTNRFVELAFDMPPDVFHCTYQLPLRAKGARNIYTIHDLVPLRLPFTTLDNKRQMFRLLKKIAAEADHIVTVSECSRQDIVTLLGVEENRVTNTYQAVAFPEEQVARPAELVAEQLEGSFGLEFQNYLLFFGALEPKKNVGRLIEAYLASGVDIPLVLVAGGGWQNEAETKVLETQLQTQEQRDRQGGTLKRRVIRFEYVGVHMLVNLIKGARAVLFPSLYEGFGMPVLEAMVLGTPVVTSSESSLPEVAGDAALLVNPYDSDAISQAIKQVSQDADLRAELSLRGREQAALFSIDRYRERVQALYDSLR